MVQKSLPSMKFVEEIHKLGGQVFEVGGSIRDELLGLPQKDRDFLVLRIPYPDLKILLKKLGRVIEAGKSFGVLKFKPRGGSQTFDIALPRLERSTGPKHRDFEVQFDETLPVEVDLKRRDFTINAIAREFLTGKIIDPFHGEQDLKNRQLRQVFSNTFAEDPLRLLRAIQFAARFHLNFEQETYAAMKQEASKIQTISPERVLEEIGKLFRARQPSQGFYWMKEIGLLPFIFPELQKAKPEIFDHQMRVLDLANSDQDLENSGNPTLLFAALFENTGNAQAWLRHYRATMLGVSSEEVVQILRHWKFDISSFKDNEILRRWIKTVGKNVTDLTLDLRLANAKAHSNQTEVEKVSKFRKRIQKELSQNPPLSIQDLAIDGSDLIQLGYTQGPTIGKILNQALDLVLKDPSQNNKKILLDWIQHEARS